MSKVFNQPISPPDRQAIEDVAAALRKNGLSNRDGEVELSAEQVREINAEHPEHPGDRITRVELHPQKNGSTQLTIERQGPEGQTRIVGLYFDKAKGISPDNARVDIASVDDGLELPPVDVPTGSSVSPNIDKKTGRTGAGRSK